MGLDSSYVLGALIISQIQIAAMRRTALPEHARAPFPLYIDEFQNYTSDDPSAFQRILTEARKYNLRLVLAHQYICPINRGVAEAIFGAVGTMISFRVGVDDPNYLQRVFGGFTNDDLQNLSIGEAICRSGRAQDSFSLKTYDTYDKPKKPETDWTAETIEHSRTHYGVPIEKDEKHGQRGSEKWLPLPKV